MSFNDQQCAMSIICTIQQMSEKLDNSKQYPFENYENLTLQDLEILQSEIIKIYNNVFNLILWCKDNNLATFDKGKFWKIIDPSVDISIEDMFIIYHNRNLIN